MIYNLSQGCLTTLCHAEAKENLLCSPFSQKVPDKFMATQV